MEVTYSVPGAIFIEREHVLPLDPTHPHGE
jgi:hypothetical protein